jgi:hypothetical protein
LKKTIIFELADGQKKAYSGIPKAGELQRVVNALVSERSRGRVAGVVHSPNHLAAHVVLDAAATTSATTTKQEDSEAVMILV